MLVQRIPKVSMFMAVTTKIAVKLEVFKFAKKNVKRKVQGWVGEKCQSGAGPIEIIDNWYVAWLCNLREVSVTETDKFFLINNLQISVVDRIDMLSLFRFSLTGEKEETSNRSFIQPFDIQNQQNWRNDKCKIHVCIHTLFDEIWPIIWYYWILTKDSVSTDIPKPFAQRMTNLLT